MLARTSLDGDASGAAADSIINLTTQTGTLSTIFRTTAFFKQYPAHVSTLYVDDENLDAVDSKI